MRSRPALAAPALAALVAVAACSDTVELRTSSLPPESASSCGRLLEQLPDQVADQPRRDVSPADAGAAWGDPAIELVCGVPVPEAFGPTSMCVIVNGVDWFVPEEQLEAQGDLVMTLVNREQHVEVRMPAEYWPPATSLADLAPAVASALEATGSCS